MLTVIFHPPPDPLPSREGGRESPAMLSSYVSVYASQVGFEETA